MAEALEHQLESCTCESGMRGGLRCADCGGRGVVTKGTQILGGTVEPTEGDTVFDDDLEDLSHKHLQSRAKDLGLSGAGSKVVLVNRIRAFVAETGQDGEQPADEQESSEDDGS